MTGVYLRGIVRGNCTADTIERKVQKGRQADSLVLGREDMTLGW